MSDFRIRVESIYDLALSKLLMDQLDDVTLVNPSPDQINFLGVEDSNQPHDLHVGDLEYRSGLQIKGDANLVQKIEELLRENLPDSIIFHHKIQQDAIYNATVSKFIERKHMAILDLGNNQQGIIFNVNTRVGANLVVQISELTAEKDKLPVCSETITLTGDYVILEIGGSFVRVSRKIKGKERQRLHSLGKEIVPPGFGIIIRTSADSITEEEIVFEINKLRQLWERINDDVSNMTSAQKLVTGELVSEVFLGNASKMYFDKLRTSITDTLVNYHLFKAYSMASGFTADFAQNVVDEVSSERLSSLLKEMIIQRDYPVNNHVKAEFNYLDGTKEEQLLGNIVQSGEVMVTSRKFERDHRERFPIFSVNEGDIVETYFSFGSWTIHYRYLSGLTGELIGEKLHIITPLDLIYRGRIRAFDMGMFLFKNSTGETTSQVDNSISNMVEQGMISKDLDSKLGEVLRVAMEMLKKSSEEIILIQLGL